MSDYQVRKALHKLFNHWNEKFGASTIKPKFKIELMQEGLKTFTSENLEEINEKWLQSLRNGSFKFAFNWPKGGGATGSSYSISSYHEDYETKRLKAAIQGFEESRAIDWDKWKQIPVANLSEACWLSLGVDPEVEKALSIIRYDAVERGQKIKGTQLSEITSLDKQYKKRLEIAEANTPLNGGNLPLFDAKCRAKLSEFGGWASTMNWQLPQEFPILEEKENNPLAEYVDSELYPKELDIAFQVWRAVAINNQGSGKTPKERMAVWLKKHYSELSGAAIDRITVVANWSKTGKIE